MTISVFRWTDGPYLAFDDPDGRRYLLEQERAALLLERMRAHIASTPDRTLVTYRHFFRDPTRDLTVIEIYLQDCDDLFEIITATGPILHATSSEVGTLLRLAFEPLSPAEPRPRRARQIPAVTPAIIAALSVDGNTGISYG